MITAVNKSQTKPCIAECCLQSDRFILAPPRIPFFRNERKLLHKTENDKEIVQRSSKKRKSDTTEDVLEILRTCSAILHIVSNVFENVYTVHVFRCAWRMILGPYILTEIRKKRTRVKLQCHHRQQRTTATIMHKWVIHSHTHTT